MTATCLSLGWLLIALCMPAKSAPAAKPPSPYELFHVTSAGGPSATISGWLLTAKRPQGTLIMCHGFGQNKDVFIPYGWIREKENWNVIAFDFREHGQSTQSWRHLSTLGYNEIWDVKAVIDWADARKLQRPYAILGVSMGASIGLRWAAEDHRIVGVLAESAFTNAWDALQKFQFRGTPLGFLRTIVRGGFRQMLQQVDIPAAVAKRDDLLIWLTCGEHDWFAQKDQEQILAASHSPEKLKQLFVLPGFGHAQDWKAPDANDARIKAFLVACGER